MLIYSTYERHRGQQNYFATISQYTVFMKAIKNITQFCLSWPNIGMNRLVYRNTNILSRICEHPFRRHDFHGNNMSYHHAFRRNDTLHGICNLCHKYTYLYNRKLHIGNPNWHICSFKTSLKKMYYTYSYIWMTRRLVKATIH